MITRRCSERRFLMRPDPETTNAFIYCLGVAAKRTGVEVIFYLAMSNHYHAGIVDPAARLPEFLEYFHKLFAKHQNVLRGRWENFWASEQTSAVELVSEEDVLAKMVYTLTNPVKAQLVETASEWPGATSLNAQMTDTVVRASRPQRFFRADGNMPADVELRLARPPGLDSIESADYLSLLREGIAQVEAEAATWRSANGGRALGPSRILQQPWDERPQTVEPRRALDPRVASKNTWRRVETIQRNRAFTTAHRIARELIRAGKDAVFPFGTYWLQRFVGMKCEIAPSPA